MVVVGMLRLTWRKWNGHRENSRRLEVACQPGRKGGRKRHMTDSKIKSAKKLLASGVPPRDVADNLGVSLPTLYRWIPASTHP
jgi:DNA invertase Pin-like site-specific DNA recombinase